MAMDVTERRSGHFRPSPAIASGEKLCEFILATDDPYLIQTVNNAILLTIIVIKNSTFGEGFRVGKMMYLCSLIHKP